MVLNADINAVLFGLTLVNVQLRACSVVIFALGILFKNASTTSLVLTLSFIASRINLARLAAKRTFALLRSFHARL